MQFIWYWIIFDVLTNMPENANKKGVVLELFQPNETNVF